MSRSGLSLFSVLAIVIGILSGCGGEEFSDADKATIASLSLASLPAVPADPTNQYADDPAAAAFGATLFFEQRMSRDGNVSCGTCHLIDRQFQDDLPRAKAVGTTNRRTMPLAGAAYSPWQFWDGRRDSLWAQALTPLEDPVEHAGTRVGYAHVIAALFFRAIREDLWAAARPYRNSRTGRPTRYGDADCCMGGDGRRSATRHRSGFCQSRQGDRGFCALHRVRGNPVRPVCQGDC